MTADQPRFQIYLYVSPQGRSWEIGRNELTTRTLKPGIVSIFKGPFELQRSIPT